MLQGVSGNLHTCISMEDGYARCFGSNMFGQLGYGHVSSLGDDEPPADIDLLVFE